MKVGFLSIIALLLCSCAQRSVTSATPVPLKHPGTLAAPTTGGAVALKYETVQVEKKGEQYQLVVTVKNDRQVNTDNLSVKEATIDGIATEGAVLSDSDPAHPISLPLELAAGFLTPGESDTIRFVMPKDFKPSAQPKVRLEMHYGRQKMDCGYEGPAQIK